MVRLIVSVCFVLLAAVPMTGPAAAQVAAPEAVVAPKSAGRAMLLSLVLPGLGHRYAHDGNWRGMGTAYALADAAFWLGLAGAEWRHDHVIESYRTLAVSEAGAQLDGKDRRFFLNLAGYLSSDDFLDTQLRNRSWDQIDYVSDPSFQWQWSSVEAFQEYRDLRDDADAWSRRRTVFLSALVANRLLAGLTAVRAARRATTVSGADLSLSLTPPPPASNAPALQVNLRW